MTNTIGTDDLAAMNQKAGNYWFEPDTLRFFRSRYAAVAYVSASGEVAYFTSSEKGPSGVRAYTVRRCQLLAVDGAPKVGSIDTLGTFQGYATLKQADAAARRAAGGAR